MGRVLVVGNHGHPAEILRPHPDFRDHEICVCAGEAEALQMLRQRAVDVVITNRSTPIGEDLALSRELSAARPGIRIIVLAPAATREDVIEALRAHVFACFTTPYEDSSVI